MILRLIVTHERAWTAGFKPAQGFSLAERR
jgi:hypothetical protein